MEGPGYRDEVEQLIRHIYSQYDTANTGTLEGETQERFMREFKVNHEESATLDGFRKKYNKEMGSMFAVFDKVNTEGTMDLCNKNVTVGIQNDDTASVKSYLHLDYYFSAERRQLHLKESFPNLSFDTDTLFLLVKVETPNQAEVKETVEGLFEMGKQMGKQMLNLSDRETANLETTVDKDSVVFKLTLDIPFFNMLVETAKILSKRLQKVVADVSLRVDMSRSFDDLLNHKEDDALRTMLKGAKVSLTSSTNAFTSIVEVLDSLNLVKKRKIMAASLLSCLDVDAKLNLKMSNVETNVFWKNLPTFKLFSVENMLAMTAVNYVSEFQNSMPFLQTLLGLSGHHEVVLNSPVGLFRLQLGSTGFNSLLDELKKTFSA